VADQETFRRTLNGAVYRGVTLRSSYSSARLPLAPRPVPHLGGQVSAKKRNPQDATLRNIRALKARVTTLEQQVRQLQRTAKRR